jgi:hypothetical protein
MKGSFYRCTIQTSHRFNALKIWWTMLLGLLFCPLLAHGQNFSLDKNVTRSISGQFIIYASPQVSKLSRLANVAADTNFVRLEPALLAVSAERIKDSLWRRLEIKPGTPWRGQIYLAVHPARSLDEEVNIISKRLAGGWDYRVELPDVLERTRFTRALTGVLLLELANRNAQSHSAEIPPWLADGFAMELLAAGSPEFVLSVPDKLVNGLPVTRINATQHGLDPLAGAQRVLQNRPPLTFEQLAWPSGAQLAGTDGGAYRATAQVFVSSLLDLKNGAAQMRVLLESLPHFYNWQIAFQSAFRANFPHPLDAEKWWALQLAAFTVRDPGPLWTPEASRARLDQLLTVPVEARAGSNSLPAHAEISLQAVIRGMNFDQQVTILRTRLNDLGLAQYRMTPQFAALTAEYRRILANYLGENTVTITASTRQRPPVHNPSGTIAARTLKKLDELDARRRNMASTVRPEIVLPSGPAR